MSSHRWKPKSHEEIHDKVERFATNFTSEFRTRVGLAASTPPGKYVDEEFFPLIATYLSCHTGWKDPSKRSHEDTLKLQLAEEALLSGYVQVVDLVRGNPLVTAVDLDNLGFPPRGRKKRQPVKQEDEEPRYWFVLLGIRRVGIVFAPLNDETKKGKPAGQQGAEARILILKEPRQVRLEELVESRFATRSPMVIEVEDVQQGSTIYAALRWENNRGEKGPFGPIISIVIP